MERKEFLFTCATLCTTLAGIDLLTSCRASGHVQGARSEKGVAIDKKNFMKERAGKTSYKSSLVCTTTELKYPVYVSREKTGSYRAFLMRCTHQGTELTAHGDLLVCNAHGSEFSRDGTVIQGPADRSLQEIPVVEDENHIYLKL